jgi:hypothetical protein
MLVLVLVHVHVHEYERESPFANEEFPDKRIAKASGRKDGANPAKYRIRKYSRC